ncbi:restriction endonuclease subunit S [Plebeiibacterium marinum]|uniref:Restriction endonuclease subunit S n=1 Tax=Plebeiibacterium marinum TaxID=2992111 RepID=A0AAE3ME05_9BACT|nr:restriction endonuclease subunit S [Plebeiobacterium marinum]MCW3806126.1 restriction endonuclease subunit S [Plebeiobacterium marinum]
MNSWKNIRLGQIAEFRNGVNYDDSSFGKGIKLISVSDFKDRMYPEYDSLGELDANARWPEECFLKEGDVVFVRSNGNKNLIGRSIYIKNIPDNELVTYSAFCIRLRFLPEKKLSPFFYLYVFKSPLFRSLLSQFGNGANINNLNQSILNNIEVPNPPLPTQQKIASILSAYDDLIENNNQRIKLLEEMAEEIYKEWFVRLRFPDYENVKVVDGVPEGWEIKTVDEIFEYVSRGVTPVYQEDSSLFAINQKVNKGKLLEKQYLKSLDPSSKIPNEKYAKQGDILLNSLGEGTLGRVHFYTDLDATYPIDQHMTILRCKQKSKAFFVYMFLQSKLGQGLLDLMKVGGTNMTMLNLSDVKKFKILIPKDDLINKYFSIVDNSFELKQNLLNKNTILQQTRDLLLPRLISGKLSVEDINIEYPENQDELNMAAEPTAPYN